MQAPFRRLRGCDDRREEINSPQLGNPSGPNRLPASRSSRVFLEQAAASLTRLKTGTYRFTPGYWG
jgi:hypothetical protein